MVAEPEVSATADVTIEVPVSDVALTHAVLDRASVPRTGYDQQQLSLEQRTTILVCWYQRGIRR